LFSGYQPRQWRAKNHTVSAHHRRDCSTKAV